MGLFRKKKRNVEGDPLLWVSFVIALLTWLVKSLKDFPQVPDKPKNNAGANTPND